MTYKDITIMTIGILIVFVALVIVIRRRKSQSIPLERDMIITSEGIYLKPVGSHATDPFVAQDNHVCAFGLCDLCRHPELFIDTKEEQRTGDETV